MGRELSLIQMGEVLIVSIPSERCEQSLAGISERVLRVIDRHLPRGVIFDLSGVASLDAFGIGLLSDLVASCRFMGSSVSMVGVRPAAALACADLGVALSGAHIARTLDDALADLEGRCRSR